MYFIFVQFDSDRRYWCYWQFSIQSLILFAQRLSDSRPDENIGKDNNQFQNAGAFEHAENYLILNIICMQTVFRILNNICLVCNSDIKVLQLVKSKLVTYFIFNVNCKCLLIIYFKLKVSWNCTIRSLLISLM